MLSREIIQINRASGRLAQGLLSYELRPDNRLTVTLTRRDRNTFEVTDIKETFNLSSNEASETRHSLWRLRPAELEGIEKIVRPADCPQPPTDTFAEASVAFIAEGPKPGIQDDHLGVVDVPAQFACNTKQGVQARAVLERVLTSFPPSKAAAEYNRRGGS